MKCECRETKLLKNKYNVNDCECLLESINYCIITVYCKVVVILLKSTFQRLLEKNPSFKRWLESLSAKRLAKLESI